MVLIEKKNAVKIFYYFLTADGSLDAKEMTKFDAIGQEMDPDGFAGYKDDLIAECNAKLGKSVGDDEYVEVVQEAIDEVINEPVSAENSAITARLLVWNMLALAYADSDYSAEERKVLMHIMRTTNMDRSVFLEMEQLMKTAVVVSREIDQLSASNRPYSQMRPIVEEAEKRYKIITESAKDLIEDEVEADVPYEEKKSAIKEKMAPVTQNIKKEAGKISEKAAPVVGSVKENAGKVAGDVLGGAGNFFNKLGSGFSRFGSKNNKKEE